MKLQISKLILKRLEHVKQPSNGCLFGVFYGEGTLLLLGFYIESTLDKLNYEQIQHKFPAEFDLCGLVKIGDSTNTDADLCKVLKNVDITDNPILLQCNLNTLVGMHATVLMHGQLQDISYEIIETEQLYRDFCFTRLKCRLELITAPKVTELKHDMQKLRKQLANGSLVFKIPGPEIIITSAGASAYVPAHGGCAITAESRIDELLQSVTAALADEFVDNGENVGTKKSNKQKTNCRRLAEVYGALGSDYDVVNIEALRCKTRDLTGSTNNPPAPAFSVHFTRQQTKVSVPLEVEALAILYKRTKVSHLYDVLIESICRLLRLFEQSLLVKLAEYDTFSVPHCYHFFPKGFGHFLTLSYLDDHADNDSAMLEMRKALHYQFALPLNQPYFLRANRCRFYDEHDLKALKLNGPLLNPHVGLRASGVDGGSEYLVQGNYQYYHYLQQGMQDNGWGCAYRSLQTICSWFILQGYTTRASVPTHREIQEYLHKIGDKPASFVGSKQWIGSTEVSMCLQGFLNVDSKILHLATGAEMSTVESQLAAHFQRHGTPIMIGGGVLAHTILGVSYSMATGQIKFLILDPHYTGAEDLATIQAKGWCGWKGIEFWNKTSFYNLCMPQLPIIF